MCAGVNASPTVVDLNGDGRAEIIVGGFGHKLFVWNYLGQLLPGWPIDVWDGISSSAAVADLNGDGNLDIIIGSDAEQYCADCKPFGILNRGGIYSAWNLNGTLVAGWPVAVDAFAWSSPAVADLDGNGTPEVVTGSGFFGSEVATRGRSVSAWNANGSLRWRFSTNGAVLGSPLVADINNDGTKEVLFGDVDRSGAGISFLYVLNSSGQLLWQSQGTTGTSPPAGFGAIFGSPVVADTTGDGMPEIVVVDSNWHMKIFANNGTPLHDFSTSFAMQNSPQVGDLDGNGTNELILASAAQNGYAGNIGTLAGQGEVFVFNTPGTGGARSAQADRAFPQPGPQYVTSVSASRSRARIGLARSRFTDTMIIYGANFAGDTVLTINGVNYPIASRTSTQLVVVASSKRIPRRGVLVLSQSGGVRRKAYRI